MTEYERSEYCLHFFSDVGAFVLRYIGDGNRGYAAVTAVGPDVNATGDPFFCERRENLGERSCGGVPSKLRLEHLADAGERHRINLENLNRDRRALGRALTDPGLQFTRIDCRARFQLHVADRQFAGIGIGLADDSGKSNGGMLEQDLLDRSGIDIVAAADHQVLGAAGDPEKAVFVETAKIARIDPIAVNERALVVRRVEITREDSRPRHDHDADLVYC